MTTITTTESRKKIYELLISFSNGMLTSISATQTPAIHSRPMAIAEVSDEGEILVVTHANSTIVGELNTNSDTTFTCQDEQKVYLSFSCIAHVSEDRAKLKEIWNSNLQSWFPEGPESPFVALIVLTPQIGEYWDSSGVSSIRYVIEQAKASITGKAINQNVIGEHDSLNLSR